MADKIEELKEEIDTLHARLDAHRVVFTVLMTAIGDIEPQARDDLMRGLVHFEAALRRTNERDVVLSELRAVREILASVEKPEDSEEGA